MCALYILLQQSLPQNNSSCCLKLVTLQLLLGADYSFLSLLVLSLLVVSSKNKIH